MSIDRDDKGHPRIEAEVEIQATPEAVWKAIATGPGIKSWFMGMENEFDERPGGEVRTKMGDKMIPIAEVTAWDPPKHFATVGNHAFGPGSPNIAYEWTVESKGGGKCVMRMVQTLFAEDEAWDTQVGDTQAGWPAFFHILRNYVERHADQPSGVVQAMGPISGTKAEAFERLTTALGVTDLTKGATVRCTTDGAPSFTGEIEDILHGRTDRVMLRLTDPFPGTAWISAGPINGSLTAIATMYYYGEGAPEAAARDHAQLTDWLKTYGETVAS